jgi:hypothetical protein
LIFRTGGLGIVLLFQNELSRGDAADRAAATAVQRRLIA